MEEYKVVLENARALETDRRLVPEVEDRKIESQLIKVKSQLSKQATKQGCRNFI